MKLSNEQKEYIRNNYEDIIFLQRKFEKFFA